MRRNGRRGAAYPELERRLYDKIISAIARNETVTL